MSRSDFAKSSRQVTGCPILFDVDLASGPHAPFLNSLFFGIEFSPKGQYLYVTTYGDGNLFVPRGLPAHPIRPAGVVIDTSSSVNVNTNKPNADMGELQLAPDGRDVLLFDEDDCDRPD